MVTAVYRRQRSPDSSIAEEQVDRAIKLKYPAVYALRAQTKGGLDIYGLFGIRDSVPESIETVLRADNPSELGKEISDNYQTIQKRYGINLVNNIIYGKSSNFPDIGLVDFWSVKFESMTPSQQRDVRNKIIDALKD